MAAAWAALGVPSAPSASSRRWRRAPRRTQAVVARTRGRLAHLRHDFAEAERQLARAAELEPNDGGEALFRRALLCFERRQDDALEACLAEARGRELSERVRWSLEAIGAMAAMRVGELERAGARLDAQLGEARRRGDELREALVRNNLALLERRRGRARRRPRTSCARRSCRRTSGCCPASRRRARCSARRAASRARCTRRRRCCARRTRCARAWATRPARSPRAACSASSTPTWGACARRSPTSRRARAALGRAGARPTPRCSPARRASCARASRPTRRA
ncbi:MAG: hypothetical protein H6828_06070 [Planctomycetes bacterium]|nr:hypothetical protein [Planctomycetota bacterium]